MIKLCQKETTSDGINQIKSSAVKARQRLKLFSPETSLGNLDTWTHGKEINAEHFISAA